MRTCLPILSHMMAVHCWSWAVESAPYGYDESQGWPDSLEYTDTETTSSVIHKPTPVVQIQMKVAPIKLRLVRVHYSMLKYLAFQDRMGNRARGRRPPRDTSASV